MDKWKVNTVNGKVSHENDEWKVKSEQWKVES